MPRELNFLAMTAPVAGNYSVSQLRTASQTWCPDPDTCYIDQLPLFANSRWWLVLGKAAGFADELLKGKGSVWTTCSL